MNTQIKATLAALITIGVTPHLAQAQDSGLYLGGSIGYNAASDQTSEGQMRLVEVEYDDGFALGSYVGYRLNENIRLEGELTYRRNDGDALAFNGVDRPFSGSGTDSYSLFGNVLYDFPNSSSITPYVGAGAGIGFLENDFAYGPAVFEDNDTAFAYQGIVGASVPVTEKIEVFLDGHYVGASGVDFVRTSPADNGVSLESEYDNVTVSVGYRYKF